MAAFHCQAMNPAMAMAAKTHRRVEKVKTHLPFAPAVRAQRLPGLGGRKTKETWALAVGKWCPFNWPRNIPGPAYEVS